MSDKRRDNKNRILRTGESQRKDGRYEYRYTDADGKRKTVYSWRLVETDRHPPGKRRTQPLRTMEEQIKKQLEQHEDKPNDVTIDALFKILSIMKSRNKLSTRTRMEEQYKKHLKPVFGNCRVQDIKYTMMVDFFVGMLDKGYEIGTIKILHSIINGCMRIAVRDGLILYNPCTTIISDIKGASTESKPRMPLTKEERKVLLWFVKNHHIYNKYYSLFVFLLGTGCRIGEAIGIRWDDIDMKNDIISINHQIQYYCQDGKRTYAAETPKTKNSVRQIPLLPSVKRALQMERKRQMLTGIRSTVSIDGYSNFVFVTKSGYPIVKQSINALCHKIRQLYNEQESEQAKAEHREPLLLPRFSPHIFRHTFCTMLCEQQIEVKMIQEVMGHNDIKTTLDIYTKVTEDMRERNYDKIKQAIKIG